jgi:hypothetical protein
MHQAQGYVISGLAVLILMAVMFSTIVGLISHSL